MKMENALITALTKITGSQRQALTLAGVSRSTWQYRLAPRAAAGEPIPQAQRAYSSRVCPADRQQVLEHILAGWATEVSVDHAYATAWDDGIYLASRRTWWRIAESYENQLLRPTVPTRKNKRQPRAMPVLKATAPGQIWSWDITDLYSPWQGKVFKAYKIIDIFSREIKGWRVEDREADHLAVDLFEDAIRTHSAPHTVHADSGAAMKSGALKDALGKHHITLTHNRPYVSNDNPFSEAGFKTMKYRPGYPKIFTELEAARTYVNEYVRWYNTEHKHSGIALFSPSQVDNGSWQHVWDVRDQALQRYYDKHPERFTERPTTPKPADHVGINLPKPKPETQPQPQPQPQLKTA
jgi:putative transposase